MQILQAMNWVDVIVLIVLIRISYVSFKDGLSHEFLPLFGALASIIIGLHYYKKFGSLLSSLILNLSPTLANFCAFLVLAAGTLFLARLCKGLADAVVKVQWHPLIERIGGLITGIVRASICASLILIILLLTPLSYLQVSIRERSLTGMYFVKAGVILYRKAARFLPTIKVEGAPADKDAVINDLVSNKSIRMNVKRQGAKTRAEAEAQ